MRAHGTDQPSAAQRLGAGALASAVSLMLLGSPPAGAAGTESVQLPPMLSDMSGAFAGMRESQSKRLGEADAEFEKSDTLKVGCGSGGIWPVRPHGHACGLSAPSNAPHATWSRVRKALQSQKAGAELT